MTHITIKNVGPIKNVELDLNKINVFMGPQSSGKSTIAKIISYCSWYEKNYILESKPLKDFYSELLEFHNLEDAYFIDDSYIEYNSKNCHIVFNGNDKKTIKVTTTVGSDNVFENEKIEYIPAERNVVAIAGIGEYNKTNNNILGFLYEWYEAKREKKKESPFVLPLTTLGNISYYYTQEDDADHLILENGKEIKLQHSSSGLISITPLLIVFEHIAKTIYTKERVQSPFEIINMTSKIKAFNNKELWDNYQDYIKSTMEISKYDNPEVRELIKTLQKSTIEILGYDSDYKYSKIIIEEPELNLFPNTQQELMYYMLTILNSDERSHQLVLTTHSPYILFSLNNCMMGGLVRNNIPEDEQKDFASYRAWIDPKSVSIYEIHEGTLKSIQDEDGIIEDNYLNKAYKENSSEYLSLLNYFENEE